MIGRTSIVVDQDCDDCERCDNCDHIRPVAKTKPLKDNDRYLRQVLMPSKPMHKCARL